MDIGGIPTPGRPIADPKNMGEMADALLLASTRVEPRKLNDAGYLFRFTDLADCLRFYLGKHRLESAKTSRATSRREAGSAGGAAG